MPGKRNSPGWRASTTGLAILIAVTGCEIYAGLSNLNDLADGCIAKEGFSCVGAPTVFAVACAGSSTPEEPSLTCNAVTKDDNGNEVYCCANSGSGSGSGSGSSSGSVPAGCTADVTLNCSGGANGYSCETGVNPEAENRTLSCSTPQVGAAGGTDDYCCFTAPAAFGSTTCVPDDDLTSVCPDPDSYGYQCDAGDAPQDYDVLLSCSAPTPDANGVQDDFCCTYE